MIDSLPYFEDFETVATGSSNNSSFVPCWTRLNNGSTYFGYPYVSNSTTYIHTPEGSRGLYWYGSTTTGTYGDYQYIVFPAIDTTLIDMNTVRFKFWARSSSTSYNPVFHVGVMTNPNNINTFQSFDTINIGGNTSWACYTTDFDTFAGNGSHIALRALRPTSSWYAYVDDIGIYRIPDCEGVSDIQITSISTNSADFTWTENGAASSWEVEYGPADFVRGSSAGTITTVSTLPLSISGLTPNTEYDLYITPECSEGGYAETVRYTFRTECIGIDSLPFFEDFESASTGSSNLSIFLPCWHRLNNGSMYFGYPYVSSSTTYNHTYGGGKGLYWYNSTTSGTYGDYQYVVLPAIDTLTYPMNTLQLSFWAKSSSTSYNPIFEVGILSNPYNVTDSGSFESLGTINVGNSTEWDEYTVGLNAHIGGGNYVAIRALRTTGSWYAYVDDIKLELLPNCPRVEDLTASNITINSAMLTWSDTSSTNTSWYVEYDTVNFIPGSGTVSPIAVADTFYAMTGLDSGTVYHVYVYPDCGTTIAERYLAVTTLAASPASVPYFCDFEQSGLNGWDLFNGTQTNAWCIGSDASYGGNQSLYISNNLLHLLYEQCICHTQHTHLRYR